MAWENILDILTPEGAERLRVGQVLMFDYEGSRTELKVMRKTKRGVFCRPIRTFSPQEVEAAADAHITPYELGKKLRARP